MGRLLSFGKDPQHTLVSPSQSQLTMSGLQFYSYNGVGKNNEIHFRYSQAVRIGDRIECSGQGRLGERVALRVGYNVG
jgi:hypothetical protein